MSEGSYRFRAPVPVRRAVALMYGGALVFVLLTALIWGSSADIQASLDAANATKQGREHLSAAQLDQAATITHVTFTGVHLIATILWVAMALLCYRGVWWARILSTVLALLGLLLTWGFVTRSHLGGAAATLSVIGSVVGVAAVILLWHSASARHFAPRPPKLRETATRER